VIDDDAIGLLESDGEGATLLQYAVNCLPIDEAQHLGRLETPSAPSANFISCID